MGKSRRNRDKLKAARNRCIVCGSNENLTLEHLLPRALGGTSYFYNTVVTCADCNSAKNSLHPLEWVAKLINPSQELLEVINFSLDMHAKVNAGLFFEKLNKNGIPLVNLERCTCVNCKENYNIPAYFEYRDKPYCNFCSPKYVDKAA